ncbi:MAG: M48 family metallopeptidase [Rhodoferax sp.]|nr:M48 family metallopeptidase [Rhodoferax sp.]
MARAGWSVWRGVVALLALGAVSIAGAGLAQAREGVEVGGNSAFSKLVPAEDVEAAAAKEYAKLLDEARAKRTLAGADSAQLRRLRAIAQRIIPLATDWNDRASSWKWEVNLLDSKEINAFCMPGGKIAVYSGLLQELKLSDDEVAMVLGHEMAHALREHARERMGKSAATGIGASLLSQLLGLGDVGQTVTRYGAELLTLKFGREDESEADLVGMELAAKAGFNPRAGVSLWQKMAAANKGAPPEWLSTHPSGSARIAQIEANLPQVLPIYERARKAKR